MPNRQRAVQRFSRSKMRWSGWTWRFGCLIPQQDAEDSGMCPAAPRKPIAFQLESVGTVAEGRTGKSRVRADRCCSICPSPTALSEPAGAEGEASVSRSLRNRALISSPIDIYWPDTRSCSRDAYRVAAARIIGRLPRSISVHVSLRWRSGYGTFTKHQPSIIQPLRATVYVGVQSRADPASRLLGQGGPQ